MSSSQPLTGRVPFTTPQISATYDAQQMRTVLNGIVRSIPVSAGTINVTEPPYSARPNTGPRWETYDDAVASGHDSSVAFNAALADVLATGGKLVIPGGQYYLNRQWLGTYTNQYVNVCIDMEGAELFAGPAVTGSAIKIVGSAVPKGITLRGGTANHRNNTTVAAFLELQGHSHGVIRDTTVEVYNTKAGYAGVILSPITLGDDNTQCFWTTIDNFKIRERSGGDGTVATHGVWLNGCANATRIINSSFTSCVNGVSLTTDGVLPQVANGVSIHDNAFEADGLTNAVNVVADPGGLWPWGLRVYANRCEATTNFFSMTQSSAGTVTNHSIPPSLWGNDCVNGSVTNWIYNPTNANINVLETSAGGFVTAGTRLQSYQQPFKIVLSGEDKHLILANESGNSTWHSAHFQMGEDTTGSSLHLWLDTSTPAVRYKIGSVPTSATDGVQIATAGSNDVPALGTSPRFSWDVTGAAVDEKRWDFLGTSSGTLTLRLLNDAQSSATNVFQIVRVAMVVNRIDINTTVRAATDATYDLGGSANRWRDFYISRDAKIGGKFGVNGATPQAATAVNAACTDLPTVIALTNQLRALLIANGQAV